MIEKVLPYMLAFAGSLILTLILTPAVRELNRCLGIVDKPDARRINKVPIPRGGGLAILLGVAISYAVFLAATGRPALQGLSTATFCKMASLAFAIAALGFVDDKWSLRPSVKLLGQIAIATLLWAWAGLGFRDLWPWIPGWLDCFLTVFWIVGAVNAFNLIDGLDGLASGIALIATIGMAGGCFYVHNPQKMLFYFAFAGGLLGFLRYNYHPASVFLGDCGSMLIGFMVATLPLVSHVPNSFLVSVGVPLLAMGVPIFDTALAILRRTLRRLVAHGSAASGRVMTADSDHLHHRLLRQFGMNQRKAAWMLYALAAVGVAFGFLAMVLESKSGGLWLASLAVVSVVVFKDATVEMFDAGRLLDHLAHRQDPRTHRRLAVWTFPFYVIIDITLLVGVYFVCTKSLGLRNDEHALRSFLPVRVVATFLFLMGFGVYRTVWSRANGANYFRLLVACTFGAVAGSVFAYYWPSTTPVRVKAMTFAFAVLSFFALWGVRVFRGFVRDLFYILDCARLRNTKGVSRVLVYGAGLRYRFFLRELIRTTSANDRVIVGLLDDDAYLKGKYVGRQRVYGTLADAPAVINALNVDTVVVACVVSAEWLKAIKDVLAPTGVKVTQFSFSETQV